ncbi:hypothetical protein EI613_05590 [Azospirillum sp. 412522]|nr:hypothetical protein [Azospirillum sp. 412522]MBY6261403.1 hypothetical protein [Azospirillum sp. 412522]
MNSFDTNTNQGAGTVVAFETSITQFFTSREWAAQVFALLSFSLVAIIVIKYYKSLAAGDVIKLFGLLMIINASLLIVVFGYSDKQIVGPISLLSTISGYLLGQAASKNTPNNSGPATGTGTK